VFLSAGHVILFQNLTFGRRSILDKDLEKPGASIPHLAEASEPLAGQLREVIDLLKEEVEYLRRDRDRLEDRVVDLEQAQEKEREQWKDRFAEQKQAQEKEREQWKEEREQWKEEREQWKDRFAEQKRRQEKEREQWEESNKRTQAELEDLKQKLKDLSHQLKKSQGIDPSSEKGCQLAGASGDSPTGGDGNGAGGGGGGGSNSDNPANGIPDSGKSSHRQRYLDSFKGRSRKTKRDHEFGSDQEFWQGIGSDPCCIPSRGHIFSSKAFQEREEQQIFEFSDKEKKDLFGKVSGLHSKKRTSTVYRLDLAVNKVTCLQESLTCLEDGVRFTKEKSLGPVGTQISWDTLATIAILVAEYAFPMERLSKAIGYKYFSSGNISRWFINSAHPVLPIYIAIGKALGYCKAIRMDDTSSQVLGMRNAVKAGLTADRQLAGEEWDSFLETVSSNCGKNGYLDLLKPVFEAFGRVSSKANSEDAKKSINVTLISGKLDQDDHASMVYFYRTHFGQAGNLLSRILEHRSPHKPGEYLYVQSDRSHQNNVETAVANKFRLMPLGCTSHARRGFYRHREKDPQAAFFLLRCFAALAHMEELLKKGPLTKERILRVRSKYGRKIWALILSTCRSITKGREHPLAENKQWKRGDSIFDAGAYVLRNRAALTLYLKRPELGPDNDASEQGLRGEKLIESASLFRNSENGRVALDIHRSMIASCNACGLEYRTFLEIISKTEPELIQRYPERYFPNNIAQAFRQRGPPESIEDNKPTFH